MLDMRKGKARMGRPPWPESDRHGKFIAVRLTQAEYVRVKADAKEAGLPVGVYLADLWRKLRKGDGK